MAASPKEKFDAAVNVIHSLPKNGSFQPSYAMMLSFYGLYKQATNGPCNISKPAFWDVVGKAKWDAWNRLGSIPKEQAMIRYVDELKKIIETMPHTDNVQEFVERLGNFYEIVDDDTPVARMVRNASPKHRENPVHSASADTSNIREDINNLNSNAQLNGRDLSGYSSSDSAENSPERMASFIEHGNSGSPGGSSLHSNSSSPEHVPVAADSINSFQTSTVAHRAAGHSDVTSDSGSDAEEFCDSFDVSNVQPEVSSRKSPVQESRLSRGDPGSSGFQPSAETSVASVGNYVNPGKRSSDPAVQHVENHQQANIGSASTDRLTVAIDRLQQDMNSALVRLQAMETLFLAQKEALEKSQRSHRRPNKWRLFAGVNYPTIAFLVAWPFVVHLFVKYMSRKRH